MVDTGSKTPPIIIKKYANRRLYNTDTSSYITLEHLAQMVRDNREFKVVDAKTGDDITRTVLTQIIVEEESQGRNMLPISFLRQLISMYGDSMQALMPQYLEASMDAFRRNQEQFRKALEGAFGTGAFGPGMFGPFEQIAKQNMAMFEVAAGMFGTKPHGEAGPASHTAQETSAPQKAADQSQGEVRTKDELAELKAQMAELQNRLDKLSSK